MMTTHASSLLLGIWKADIGNTEREREKGLAKRIFREHQTAAMHDYQRSLRRLKIFVLIPMMMHPLQFEWKIENRVGLLQLK